MKKRILFVIGIFSGVLAIKSQFTPTVVWNEKLFNQIAKNQTVRLASNQTLLNSFEKQKEMYDKINEKVAQIVIIQGHIYNNLRNVNSALKQGKQLFYIYQRFGKIADDAAIVLNYTVTKPEYAVLLYQYYSNIIQELLELKTELLNEILNEENDYLMDSFDRQVLINTIQRKAMLIHGNILKIKWTLEKSNKTPYIYQIPYLKNYINTDKKMVVHILQKYKVFENSL